MNFKKLDYFKQSIGLTAFDGFTFDQLNKIVKVEYNDLNAFIDSYTYVDKKGKIHTLSKYSSVDIENELIELMEDWADANDKPFIACSVMNRYGTEKHKEINREWEFSLSDGARVQVTEYHDTAENDKWKVKHINDEGHAMFVKTSDVQWEIEEELARTFKRNFKL